MGQTQLAAMRAPNTAANMMSVAVGAPTETVWYIEKTIAASPAAAQSAATKRVDF